jgi:hypothetical protein
MKYVIDIDNDENDEFERNADNVCAVQVTDSLGNDVSNEFKVQLFLNENALLGLGTELIRLAHKYREGKHFHLEPAEVDNMCQRMGIFLTPNSSKLTISCSDNNQIDEYFKK